MTEEAGNTGKGALVLLARLDSSRLPGKQLMPLGGTTILDLMLDRLSRSRHGLPAILATSDRPVDDPLAEHAGKRGIPCFRGGLEDVAGRCRDLVREFGLDWFIRLSGDSPFIDPEIVDAVASAYLAGGCDIACNVFPRTAPIGVSAEAVSRKAMERICRETSDPAFLEHVTLFAYKNPAHYRIVNVGESSSGYEELSLAVDTAEDMDRARWILARLDQPETASLADIAALARDWQSLSGGKP